MAHRCCVRVAAAMGGGADSPPRRGPARSGVPRPRGRLGQGARLPGAVVTGRAATRPKRKTPRQCIRAGRLSPLRPVGMAYFLPWRLSITSAIVPLTKIS